MPNWSKLYALSAREKRLLVASLFALPLNGLALNLLGFNRWQYLLSRMAPVDRVGPDARAESLLALARQTARMVRIGAWHGPYRGNCLQQSLTLWWLLRRHKVESEIRFGARMTSGKFEAHAWVEFEGVALNEGRNIHRGFKPFEPVAARSEANKR